MLRPLAEIEIGLHDDERGGEELEDVSGQGLIDEAHLDLYLRWLRFGGAKRGLSPMELLELPVDLATDFLWLQNAYNKELRRAHRLKNDKR